MSVYIGRRGKEKKEGGLPISVKMFNTEITSTSLPKAQECYSECEIWGSRQEERR